MSKTRIYLATWIAGGDKKDYGFILAPKKPSSPNVPGYIFNQQSYTAYCTDRIRNDRLATAVLLCKVDPNSQRETELKEYLAMLFQQARKSRDSKAALCVAVKYLFDNRYIVETATVNVRSVVDVLERTSGPTYGIVEMDSKSKRLSLCPGHSDRYLPVWSLDGKAIPQDKREIPPFTQQPSANKRN